jgi:hypothetical protein
MEINTEDSDDSCNEIENVVHEIGELFQFQEYKFPDKKDNELTYWQHYEQFESLCLVILQILMIIYPPLFERNFRFIILSRKQRFALVMIFIMTMFWIILNRSN